MSTQKDVIKISGSIFHYNEMEKYAMEHDYQIFLLPYRIEPSGQRTHFIVQQLHLSQIMLSDYVLVWNQDQTLTKDMESEIEYAKFLKKQIFYKEEWE